MKPAFFLLLLKKKNRIEQLTVFPLERPGFFFFSFFHLRANVESCCFTALVQTLNHQFISWQMGEVKLKHHQGRRCLFFFLLQSEINSQAGEWDVFDRCVLQVEGALLLITSKLTV